MGRDDELHPTARLDLIVDKQPSKKADQVLKHKEKILAEPRVSTKPARHQHPQN